MSTSAEIAIELLRPAGLAEAQAYCRRAPWESVLIRQVLEDERAAPGAPTPVALVRDAQGIAGLMAVSGELMIHAERDDALAMLADAALSFHPPIPRVVGLTEQVSRFIERFEAHGLPLRFDRAQWLMAVTRESFRPAPDARGRVATSGDRAVVTRQAAAMSLEEIQVDPLVEAPYGYRRLVEERLEAGRYYVLDAPEGQGVAFQVHVSALLSDVAHLTGVYTAPAWRGRGLATLGLSHAVAELLEQVPAVTLVVNVTNRPAIALYERLGFFKHADWRAVFWEDAPWPLAPQH